MAANIGDAYALGALVAGTGTPSPDATAEQMHHSDTVRAEIFWSGLAVGAVMAASAIWGFHTTWKCREHVEERSRKDTLWVRPRGP